MASGTVGQYWGRVNPGVAVCAAACRVQDGVPQAAEEACGLCAQGKEMGAVSAAHAVAAGSEHSAARVR